MEFSLRNVRLYRALPKNGEAQVFGHQLLRSSSSVGANHREACQARSRAEFLSKMGDSLREMDESTYWLELIRKADLISTERIAPLEAEAQELLAIFITIVQNTKKH
jgi:four helix bundle protein